MKGRVIRPTFWMLVALTLSLPVQALATNGMYLAGYGSEAAGRGGANIAVADGALGLQANPAGIARLDGQHLGVALQLLAPSLQFRYAGDSSGKAMDGEGKIFPMPALSYARGGKDAKWAWGLGLISQGGMGATFKKFSTPFGTTDETFSEVRYMALTPTVAYNVTPALSLGLSANVGYSDVQFRFWPNTSFYSDGGTPDDRSDDMGFFGADLADRAWALNYGVRAGVMWAANERVQLGAIYHSRIEGDYENGTLRLDMSSLGLGDVDYDATVSGFTWPEQLGVGAQVRPADRWLVAADLKFYRWSEAIELIEVKGTNPSNPSSPLATVRMPFTFLWEDQWVYALGAEYKATEPLTLRAGYNYGASPVPDATLNPLFPATTRHHITVGAGYAWDGNGVHLAVERAFEASQTNTNVDQNVNPFGPGATVAHSQWTVSLGFSKAFGRK